jgi:hypothetical protein
MNLTQTINKKLSALQADVNALPNGGGLEVLRDTLMGLQDKIKAMVGDIDHINGVKDPERTPIKVQESYYTNKLEDDQGEAA